MIGVTINVLGAANPAAATAVPGGREIVIPSNGKVEIRAVIRSQCGAAAATIALLAFRLNVAVYTQDQNGITCACTLGSRKETMLLGMFLLYVLASWVWK